MILIRIWQGNKLFYAQSFSKFIGELASALFKTFVSDFLAHLKVQYFSMPSSKCIVSNMYESTWTSNNINSIKILLASTGCE